MTKEELLQSVYNDVFYIPAIQEIFSMLYATTSRYSANAKKIYAKVVILPKPIQIVIFETIIGIRKTPSALTWYQMTEKRPVDLLEEYLAEFGTEQFKYTDIATSFMKQILPGSLYSVYRSDKVNSDFTAKAPTFNLDMFSAEVFSIYLATTHTKGLTGADALRYINSLKTATTVSEREAREYYLNLIWKATPKKSKTLLKRFTSMKFNSSYGPLHTYDPKSTLDTEVAITPWKCSIELAQHGASSLVSTLSIINSEVTPIVTDTVRPVSLTLSETYFAIDRLVLANILLTNNPKNGQALKLKNHALLELSNSKNKADVRQLISNMDITGLTLTVKQLNKIKDSYE